MPTGEHEFDKLCTELGIEHRLTKPRTPQTNGMVERFNGRISDVLQSHHFVGGEDLAQTLYRYALLYNQQPPQSTLGSKTPLDAMQRWYESHPHLFVKRPCNLAGCDMLSKSCACCDDAHHTQKQVQPCRQRARTACARLDFRNNMQDPPGYC